MHDPKECREHARHCRRLAAASPAPLVKQRFLNIAGKWEGLAVEIESAEQYLKTKAGNRIKAA
jgi:hypothetical protein